LDVLDGARALLDHLTPMNQYCGKRCGAACCQGGEEDGMLLFPGEERYYENCSWADIKPDPMGLRLVCRGECPRENRPLSCRIFPMVIRAKRQEDGTAKANISMDVRAWPVCPLMQSGKKGLRADFVDTVKAAAGLLVLEDKHMAFLIQLSEELKAYEQMRDTFL